jgi:integrase
VDQPVRREWITLRPPLKVEPIGSRNRHGKLQLRPGEADRFLVKGLELAANGDEGALASVLTLSLGPRSNEVRSLTCRDIDRTLDGRVYVTVKWVKPGKTSSARRAVRVQSTELVQALLRQVEGRKPDDWLFPANSKTGYRTRTWLSKSVKRVCEAAGVSVVCPHGLRGSRATLDIVSGKDLAQVSRDLGHANPQITKDHYVEPGTLELAELNRMLEKLGTRNGQIPCPQGESN